MINSISTIKEKCSNGFKQARLHTENIYTNTKTILKPKVDEFIKSFKEEPIKSAAGAALTFGALMLAGKCLKEIKDKLVETKNE